MKNILNKNFIITLFLILLFGIIILFAFQFIKLDSTINSLFPVNNRLQLAIDLVNKSTVSDKVIIYVEVDDPLELKEKVMSIKEIINNKESLTFNSAIPSNEDIMNLLEYTSNNSLLLYPFEQKKVSPFSLTEMENRLHNKEQYLLSLPFMEPDESFFADPLMLGTDILNSLIDKSNGKYSPKYGGIISEDKKSYIMIVKSGFFNEEYEKVKKLKELDNEINSFAKENGFNAFVYSSHLYFLESITKIIFEVTLIFILTTIAVVLIFYIFFRNILLLLYSFLPIAGGFAFTFVIIAMFKPNFGGIALAFGSTITGIGLDYIIHYLTKRTHYETLKILRRKIGFSMFLSFLTTISAFLFLQFSNIVSLQEISLFGVLSLTTIFLLSWYLLQHLLPPVKNEKQVFSFKIPIVNNKYLFISWLIFSLILVLFIPFIKFEDDIMNLDMKHKELDNRKNIILEKFNESSDNIFLVFSGKNREEIITKSLKTIYKLQDIDEKFTFFTASLLTPSQEIIDQRKKLIKSSFDTDDFNKAVNKTFFENDSFDIFKNKIKDIDSITLTELPTYFQKEKETSFVTVDNNEYMLLHITDRKISNKIRGLSSENNMDFFIIDISNDTKDELVNFERKSLILLSISIVLILFILIIAYKGNLLYSFTAVLPCVISLLACIAVSYFTNNGYNIMHFVSSVLLLGIGVDYGIFVTNAYKDSFDKEELRITFQSIFVCTLTTISGFGVLSLSSSYSIKSLGTSMFLGVVSAFFTAYIAIPYILIKFKKGKFIKK